MKKFQYDDKLKTLYTCTRKEPFLVQVPVMDYLTFDGAGHPAGDDFQLACQTLFTLSYVVKFEIARKRLDMDYHVNPMEVTWYLDKKQDGIDFTWTMMIMQPPFITAEMIADALEIAAAKGKDIAADRVDFQTVDFGRCVQCFHRGDYNKMNDTLAKMQAFAQENSLECDQYTHDVYLNDMRKTKMENYKAIMRIKVRQSDTA